MIHSKQIKLSKIILAIVLIGFVVSIYLYDTDIFYSEKSNDRIL